MPFPRFTAICLLNRRRFSFHSSFVRQWNDARAKACACGFISASSRESGTFNMSMSTSGVVVQLLCNVIRHLGEGMLVRLTP